MLDQGKYIPLAENSRQTLISTNFNSTLAENSSSFDGYNHLTSAGWLTPVVNPYNYAEQGYNSPESEAFMVEMQSAWRDWVDAGSPSHGSACSIKLKAEVIWAWVGMNILVVAGAMVI